MKLNRHPFVVITVSAATVGAILLSSACAAPVSPGSPPAPAYYDDTSRSFLVELDFGSTSAALIDALVGERQQ